MVHFSSGFQIVGFVILFCLFNFRFAIGQGSGYCRLWLISFSFGQVTRLSNLPRHWRRLFSSAIFLVNFVGFLNRLGWLLSLSKHSFAKFQVWLNQVFKIGLISSAKVLVNFISALWLSFLGKDFGMCFLVLAKD